MVVCPNCQTQNVDEARFCMNCGHSLASACPQCQAELPAGSKFCFNCGFRLADSASATSTPGAGKPTPQADLGHKLDALRAQRSEIVGERRVVTALFCDVAGSTEMAERLDPEEWAAIMNGAFGYLIKPVYRYEGTVARLMGDAILAFFGAPVAHEDDPQRAVLAGLDILKSIGPYCERIRDQYGLDFDVRVGINTGPAVVGEIGSEMAMEYTAMGDAVNVAARMEQTAEPGTVQISEHTYRLVAPMFDVEPLGRIEIKGKSEPIPAYRVLKRKEQPGRLRGIDGVSARLVGREPELNLLREAIAELRQGRGQIVCLIGEAGLGKSRLIEELRREWEQAGGTPYNWSESRGIAYDTARPYGLFVQRLQQYFGVSPDDPPDVIREKVAVRAKELSYGEGELLTRAVESLLSLESASDAPPLEGEAVKRELEEAGLRLWRSFGESGPGVFVFDDLHWADPASVDALIHLFQVVDEVPVMFLCATRPYRSSPGWKVKQVAEAKYPHRYTEITLSPLSDGDSETLIDELLSIADLPPSLRRLILQKAEGNPFFVEEVVRTLIDEGIVVRDEAGMRWRAAADVENIDIPNNVHALLMARIDRLEETARHTLQLAAVIGRSFYYRVLEQISDMARALDDQLNTLERAELIQEAARTPELEYMFRHELTRDAAYKSILRSRRRQFHQRVGEALEELFPTRLEDEADRLAYHFREAGDDRRALKYYTMAGDKAARLYANAEAITHYTEALQLARRTDADAEQILYLYTQRGRTYELSAQYDEALANYEKLAALGRQRGDPSLELAALIPQATIHIVPTMRFDAQKGKALATKALELARELEDRGAESEALWNLMLLDYFTGNIPRSLTYGEQALDIAREHGLREQAAYALHDLARSYMAAGRPQEAWEAELEAYDLWQEFGNMPMLADSLGSLADGAFIGGDLKQAIEYAEEGVRISRSIGNYWGESYNLTTLGPLYIERGDISKGIETIRNAIELAERANFIAVDFTASAILTLILAQFGDTQGAIQALEMSAGEQDSFTFFPLLLDIAQGIVHTAAGDIERGQELLDSVELGDLPEQVISFYGAIIVSWMVIAASLSGEHQRALSMSDEMLAQMERIGQRTFLPDMLRARAKALLGLGRVDEARADLEQARAEAVQMTSRRSLWDVLLTWVELEEAQGNVERAEELRDEAREVIAYLADHMDGHPQLRTAFLALPRVHSVVSSSAV